MKINSLVLSLTLLLLAGEGTLLAWRAGTVAEAHGPVFSWPLPEATRALDDAAWQKVLRIYQADSANQFATRVGDLSLTAWHFAWRRLETGPLVVIGGHAPEVCNRAAGLRLVARHPSRSDARGGHPELRFDVFEFNTASGQRVFVYKMAWLQQQGPWDLRNADATLRQGALGRLPAAVRQAFAPRLAGQARVVQAEVANAPSEAAAWEFFSAEVLAKLEWN